MTSSLSVPDRPVVKQRWRLRVPSAQTLCLSINLDMVGYPTATPVLVDDSDDRLHALLAELDGFGAELPRLLHTSGISGGDGVA